MCFNFAVDFVMHFNFAVVIQINFGHVKINFFTGRRILLQRLSGFDF